MKSLESFDKREIKELLSKGWITHDAMWFAHALQTVGIEKANEINLAAVQSMSVIEAARLRRALGFKKEVIDSFDELVAILTGAMDLVVADFMRFHMTTPRKNVIHWQMEPGNCFAYKGIAGMGVIDRYDCGVLLRVKTWLSAMKVDYRMVPEVKRCIMHTRGDCSGDFLFDLA